MQVPGDQPVVRVLRWYEQDPGEALVGEEALAGADLAHMQSLFRRPADDPMHDCYPVTSRQVVALQGLVAHRIDLARHAYFVEADGLGS